MVRHLHFGTPI